MSQNEAQAFLGSTSSAEYLLCPLLEGLEVSSEPKHLTDRHTMPPPEPATQPLAMSGQSWPQGVLEIEKESRYDV